ncbi:hypothetical protein DUNSADRAFT_5485 [Dunaliella salina]|uniref:SET domain-containing protein n=1 Tax=Dunaliella salina TaxID=3046 RepID=A0ABQ7H7A0_DUNSA|nr:hypothetical protein DUNSADRAFT_5485 [Dunaliella salina]|eukprot:KAF5842718.1 hypothetical protein DUNSADRAFT_5485 [Dunaliella salina]
MDAALGPLLCLQSMPGTGGGRGVFAKHDIGTINPGTLLLREQALIAMPVDRQEQEHLHLALARAIISHPDRENLLAATAPLHPTTLADLQPDMLSELRAQHAQDVASLQALLEGGPSQPLTADSLLRLMLVMRFNAHYSGLYLASEMFNHACNPNCIKLLMRRSADVAESEIRAVRPIHAGKECCISYLNPPLQSRTRRKAHLERQHFFLPAMPAPPTSAQQQQQEQQQQQQAPQQPMPQGPAVPQGPAMSAPASSAQQQQQQQPQQPMPQTSSEQELKQPSLQVDHSRASRAPPKKSQRATPPPLPVPSNTFPAEMEAWRGEGDPAQQAADLEAIEQGLDDAEALLVAAQARLSAKRVRKGNASEAAGQVARVLRDGEALVQRASQLLHPRHVVLARAHALLVDACATILAASIQGQAFPDGGPTGHDHPKAPHDSSADGGQSPAGGRESDPVAVAMLLLRAAHELRATQDLHCGAEHLDTAKLLLDMQHALEFLLSVAPRQLFTAFPEQYGTFAKASKADHQLKQEHKRISSLYR